MWFHLLNCKPFTSVILTVNQMRQLRLLSDKTRIWPRVISTATSVWATSRCVLLRLGVRDFKEEVTFISYKLNEGKYEKRPSFWVVDDPPEKNYQCLSIRFTAFTTQARAFKIASTGLMSSVKSVFPFPDIPEGALRECRWRSCLAKSCFRTSSYSLTGLDLPTSSLRNCRGVWLKVTFSWIIPFIAKSPKNHFWCHLNV